MSHNNITQEHLLAKTKTQMAPMKALVCWHHRGRIETYLLSTFGENGEISTPTQDASDAL